MKNHTDLIRIKWLVTINISVERQKNKSDFDFIVDYTLLPDRPMATLQIASSKNQDASIDWHSADIYTHKINNNEPSSNQITLPFKEADLAKTWIVRISYTDENNEDKVYMRPIFFAEIPITEQNKQDPNRLFPERQLPAYRDRLDSAVCFSGGGTRAMLLAAGQIRFLQNHGYMKKLGYISSVSGGSWAATGYIFAETNDTEKLLGKYVSPENSASLIDTNNHPQLIYGANKNIFLYKLTANFVSAFISENMNSVEGRQFLTELFSNEFVEQEAQQYTSSLSTLWIDTIEEVFLSQPLGISTDVSIPDTAYTFDKHSLDEIMTSAGSMQTSIEQFFLVNSELNQQTYPPYYVANGLMLRPDNTNAPHYVPFEFTPLYQGAGFNGDWRLRGLFRSNSKVVGGITPAYSFNSTFIHETENETAWVMRQGGNNSGSLGTASGISSAFFAGATSIISSNAGLGTSLLFDLVLQVFRSWWSSDDTATDSYENSIEKEQIEGIKKEMEQKGTGIMPRLNAILSDEDKMQLLITEISKQIGNITPIANYFSPNEIANRSILFGDGGLSDNFGLLSMLRRNVKKVIIFVNSATEFKPASDEHSEMIDETVLAYFGLIPPRNWIPSLSRLSGIDLSQMTVFDQKDYDSVLAQFTEAKQANQTLVAETKLTVLPNSHWDIKGDYQVEILWYYNCRPTPWVDALPAKIQDKLSNSDMPFNSTFRSTAFGVNQLTSQLILNLAEWNLIQTQDKINALLD